MKGTASLLHRPRRSGLLRWPVVGGAAILLASCKLEGGVLEPQGPIASAERLLLINATAIMLVVVVPVIVATLAFAWWYRSSNTHATRSLDESYEGRVEFVARRTQTPSDADNGTTESECYDDKLKHSSRSGAPLGGL